MLQTQVNGEAYYISYFDFLPDDIILIIFKKLTNLNDLYNLRFINNRLSVIAEDKSLARHIDFRGQYWLSTGVFEDLFRPYAKYLENLNLDQCYWLRSLNPDIFLECTQLQSLHVMHIDIPASVLCRVLSNQPNLTSLSISISDIEDFHVQLAASPGAQKTLSHVVHLRLHFPNDPEGDLRPVVNFNKVPILLAYCRDVTEIHFHGNLKNAFPFEQRVILPHAIDVNNLKNVTVMTINTELDPTARHIFFRTLNHVCTIPLRFTTLLVHSTLNNNLWNDQTYKNATKNGDNLVNFQASGVSSNISSIFSEVRTSQRLRYINISDNPRVGSNDMWQIASRYQNLESLNLENCLHILLRNPPDDFFILTNQTREYDALGLERLLNSCVNLRCLNLNGVHIHPELMAATSTHKNLLSLLCINTKWQSLSVSPCCFPTEHNCSSDLGETKSGLKIKVTCRKCRLKNVNPSDPMSFLKLTEFEPETDFQRFVRLTPDMEHFELTSAGCTSAFNKMYATRNHTFISPCATSLNVDDSDLIDLYYWKKLKSLQLTSLKGMRLGYCLWTIAIGCTSLEQLCLTLTQGASIKWLLMSLPLFSKLKDIRLEQLKLDLNKNLFDALEKCSSLERICIVAPRGHFCAEDVKRLFVSLPSLFSFQLFTNESVKKCKQLMDFLLDEYQKSRPALSVCIYPLLDDNLEKVIARHVPDQHFDEMTVLKSRISIRPIEI